jgi:hypothetical protein
MLKVFLYVFATTAAHITVIKSENYYKIAIFIGKFVKNRDRLEMRFAEIDRKWAAALPWHYNGRW